MPFLFVSVFGWSIEEEDSKVYVLALRLVMSLIRLILSEAFFLKIGGVSKYVC